MALAKLHPKATYGSYSVAMLSLFCFFVFGITQKLTFRDIQTKVSEVLTETGCILRLNLTESLRIRSL